MSTHSIPPITPKRSPSQPFLTCLIWSFFLVFFLSTSTFRLKIDNNGGAWCPKHMVSRGLKEYLQIDLLQVHVITAIRTQGRFGKGQGQEYTEAYVIEYWRPGFTKWYRWKNIQGKEVSNINILFSSFFFLNIFQLICTMARCHLHFTLLICHHHQSPLMFFSSIFTNLSTKRELLNHIIAQFASLLATN